MKMSCQWSLVLVSQVGISESTTFLSISTLVWNARLQTATSLFLHFSSFLYHSLSFILEDPIAVPQQIWQFSVLGGLLPLNDKCAWSGITTSPFPPMPTLSQTWILEQLRHNRGASWVAESCDETFKDSEGGILQSGWVSQAGLTCLAGSEMAGCLDLLWPRKKKSGVALTTFL